MTVTKDDDVTLRKCKSCGKFFEIRRGFNEQKIYCNQACTQKAYRDRQAALKPKKDRSYAAHLGQCLKCGKDLWGNNPRVRFCSGRCRTAHFRDLHNEAPAVSPAPLVIDRIPRAFEYAFSGVVQFQRIVERFNADFLQRWGHASVVGNDGLRCEGRRYFVNNALGGTLAFQDREAAASWLGDYLASGVPNYAALRF